MTRQQKYFAKRIKEGWRHINYLVPGEVAELVEKYKNELVLKWKQDKALNNNN